MKQLIGYCRQKRDWRNSMIIDTLQILTDSLDSKEIPMNSPTLKITFAVFLDYAYKTSMVIIAIFNALFAIYIYISNSKKSRNSKESDRKITLLKTLILDYNLKIFYDSFNHLEAVLARLQNRECDKSEVEKLMQADFRQLNEQFIVFLEAIDNTLYQSMLNVCDVCRDEIVSNIGNEGVNLWVNRQYKDLIKKPLDNAKKEMLKQLFNYKGE